MSSRFDTPETERERKKKDWGNGWRLNYEPGNKSILDDTFKMLRDARHGKQSQAAGQYHSQRIQAQTEEVIL